MYSLLGTLEHMWRILSLAKQYEDTKSDAQCLIYYDYSRTHVQSVLQIRQPVVEISKCFLNEEALNLSTNSYRT